MGLTRKQMVTVAVLVLGTFVGIFNQTVMAPALPTIMNETGVNASSAQWLTTGFTLVNAIMIPVTAFLTDKFPLKKMFLVAMSIFAAGSVLGGIGLNFPMLLSGRLVQAAGAGILGPLVMTALLRTFPKEHRGKAMGLFGLVIAFAPAVGPTVAGIVVDVASWHVLLLAIAVFSVVVIAVAAFVLESEAPINPDASLDVLSVILSTFGFGGLLFGLSEIGSSGIGTSSLVALAVGIVSLVFFFHRQLKLPEPMLNVRVLANHKFLTSTIIVMLVQASLMAGSILLPILIQNDLGMSATMSGLIMLPAALVMGVMSPVSGTLFDKHGPRALSIVGLSVVTVTTFAFVAITQNTTALFLVLLYAFRMFGLSLANMPVNTWGMNALDTKVINHGTSVNNTFRQVAGSIGSAVLVSVYAAIEGGQRAAGVDSVQASIHGINFSFGISGVICAVGLILIVLFVRDRKGDEVKADPAGERKSIIESVMKADVFTIPANATVLEAMTVLTEKHISGAPLVDADGKLAGFVSDGDLLRSVTRSDSDVVDPIAMTTQIIDRGGRGKDFGERMLDLANEPVTAVARRRVVSVNVHSDLMSLSRVMSSNHMKKVPIVDDDGVLVGIVNRSTIVRYSMNLCLSAAQGQGAVQV